MSWQPPCRPLENPNVPVGWNIPVIRWNMWQESNDAQFGSATDMGSDTNLVATGVLEWTMIVVGSADLQVSLELFRNMLVIGLQSVRGQRLMPS